jgi:hypothetical protein
MSERQQPINRGLGGPPQDVRVGAAFANQPASFWVALLASVGVILGGVGPWATWLNSVSISGTSMHGWREVGVGVVALAMLGLYQLRGGRLALLVAWLAGASGAIGAITAVNKIVSGGAVTVLGVQYRYLDAAWGIYLVLAGALTVVLCPSLLAWRDLRATRRRRPAGDRP